MATTIPEVTIVGQPSLTTLDNPDLESISIMLPDAGVTFPHFLAYEYDEHYLTPCAKFWFDLDTDELTADEWALLVPGSRVVIQVNGLSQCSGIIDETPVRTGKGGSVLHVEGRDWLSYLVDSQVDPGLRFPPNATIAQVVTAIFDPFEFDIQAILDTNVQNVQVQTGATRGLKSNKTTGKTSKSAIAHQLQPYPNEHALEFAARICQRDGLWLRPGVEPGQVVITVPNFDQDPIYQFRHKTDDPSQNNIEDGVVTPSRKNQPSVLFAWGSGGGGVFPHAGIRCAILNPFVVTDTTDLLAAYPGVPLVELTPTATANNIGVHKDRFARPLYRQDSESHTQAEIESFARREMSLYMRQSLSIHYDIMGHTLGGKPLALDTIAGVEDDRSGPSGLHGSFWMMGRRFSKKANEGSRSHAELIIPDSIQF